MMFLSPTRHHRLNEAVGILLLLLGLAVSLSLLSYSAADPSWNTATGTTHVHNLLGHFRRALGRLAVAGFWGKRVFVARAYLGAGMEMGALVGD